MEHNIDNFSLEVIQKTTELARESYDKELEAKTKSRLRLIKKKMMEEAEHCRTSYECHFSGYDSKGIVKRIELYFLERGFTVFTKNGLGGEIIMVIDWEKAPKASAEPAKKTSFIRQFIREK